jgi:selenocysteine-specific elongation factor
MRRLILGTAGHIDHGKTALVKALTGIDTDRLKEEKERGITVDLGFAELSVGKDLRFGVVDVPGHEGFIRNMLAGATGMDLVVLVVAADEGVMPQTREHLAIVQLLGVPRLVVALTKADLVEEEWLELVRDEVVEVLGATSYGNSPIVPTSAETGQGLDDLEAALVELGESAEEKVGAGLARLPIDRVFTIRGAGTVVTGTLWSGSLEVGDRVRVLPGDLEGRIRSLQVHGAEEDSAQAGVRVAAGLTGQGISHHEIRRGQTLVRGDGWTASWMLTARVSVLPDTGWSLEQGQRVRVHLGTSEVLARTAILGQDLLGGGQEGWIQLRLEEPVLGRVRDHLVIRSYSPVTTIGGGRVAEVLPKKRRTLADGDDRRLAARVSGTPGEALVALLLTQGWRGVLERELAHRTGFSPEVLVREIDTLVTEGRARRVGDHLVSDETWRNGAELVLDAVERFHGRKPLKTGLSLEEARQSLPGPLGSRLAAAVLDELVHQEILSVTGTTVARRGYRPSPSPEQQALRDRLEVLLEGAGLKPPSLRELIEAEGSPDIEDLLRLMEEEGLVRSVDGQLFFWRSALESAGRQVVETLGGRSSLGPADFRDVVPVTRKHLVPLLRYFDTVGITTRRGDERTVATHPPDGWGTPNPEST